MDMFEKYAPKYRLSGFELKIIACAIMLAGNFGGLLFRGNETWQIIAWAIGSISFPIFAFLLVEGFFHSSNLQKYMIRLGAAAIASELAYDLAVFGVEHMEDALDTQNVLFTLLSGLITVAVYDKLQVKYRTRPGVQNVYSVLTLLVGGMVPVLLRSDYSFYGVFMVMIMYLFHKNKRWMLIALVLLIGFLGGSYGLFQLLALPFVWMYSGEEGKKAQRFFYVFYPLHLLLLSAVNQFLI